MMNIGRFIVATVYQRAGGQATEAILQMNAGLGRFGVSIRWPKIGIPSALVAESGDAAVSCRFQYCFQQKGQAYPL